MGRASTRQNKTPYQLAREELGLSRERAAELLETIPAERIERIESERSLPRPDEVLRMAQRYKKPSLCNAYCARACPIGQEYVPEIKPKELPAIVLEMLATLNTLDRERGCLIDISADGSIDPDELADFLRIRLPDARFFCILMDTHAVICYALKKRVTNAPETVLIRVKGLQNHKERR